MVSHATTDIAIGSQAAMSTVLRILKGAVAAKASDVHLRVDQPPMVRIQGELLPLEHPPLEDALLTTATHALAAYAEVHPERVEASKQLEFSCAIPDVGRFRAHAYRQRGSRALVLRHIPVPVPPMADLRLPPVVKQIAQERRGMVLVTGATGNGKSTTIAALLEFINESFCRHVVTIEDPVEFVFADHLSSFSQREVGPDVSSFQEGLEGALREDPDVIFVGEIRRQGEFEVALNAAESGHLVVSTLHATDVMTAIQRMIAFYPQDRQLGIRTRLADAVAAIISQKLLPTRGGQDRVLVTEVLRRAPSISDHIRDASRFGGLPKALEAAFHEIGTHSFDMKLLGMVRSGVLSLETAQAAARSPKDLVRAVKLNR